LYEKFPVDSAARLCGGVVHQKDQDP
jgi:hypothetical protein